MRQEYKKHYSLANLIPGVLLHVLCALHVECTPSTAVLCIVHSGALGFKLEVNQIVTDGYSLRQTKFKKKVGDVDGPEDGDEDSDGDMV